MTLVALPADRGGALPYLLVRTERQRSAAVDEIRAAFRACDQRQLADYLGERKLLPLFGSRLLELAPEEATREFESTVKQAITVTRGRSLVFEFMTAQVQGVLVRAGIPVMPLKGVTLGRTVHGDAGLRPTSDVDVLVRRADVSAAVDALVRAGFIPPSDPPWVDGLPLLHYVLQSRTGPPIAVELHWRVHWSDTAFSEALITTAKGGPEGWLRPAAVLELAMLLLFYARDSLHGLRLPADITAWWDRYATELPAGALDEVMQRYPSLRRSLSAALLALERFAGLPISSAISDVRCDRAAQRAVALADPLALSSGRGFEAAVMLNDLLLSTGRHKLGYVRRYHLHPLGEVRRTYGLQGAPVARVVARGGVHAVGSVIRTAPAIARHLRKVG